LLQFSKDFFEKLHFEIISLDLGVNKLQKIDMPDEEPQEVILSFDPAQWKYMKLMPLHELQQILVDNNNELQIKLLLYLTYDFEMELLSYGEYVKVLKPGSLVDDIKNRHGNAMLLYRDKTIIAMKKRCINLNQIIQLPERFP